MANKYKRKEEPMNRWVVLLLIFSMVLIGSLFLYSSFLNQPIEKEKAIELTCIYEEFSGHKKPSGTFTDITLWFNDVSLEIIDKYCCSDDLLEKLEKTQKETELKILKNPNNNRVIEIIANNEYLLDFDTAQEGLKSRSNAFFFLSLLTYSFAIIIIIYIVIDYKKKNNRSKLRNKKHKT